MEQFRALLDEVGASAALAALNETVPHRYTGVYRLDEGVMTNILLVDKRQEVTPEFLAAVPFEDSFCQFVLKFGRFHTTDSSGEQLLDGHKYQGVMVSYTGVPISLEGALWGTLCHFDTESWTMADDDFASMKSAALALAAHPPVKAG